MDITKLKAAIFDAEQALTWARQAIDEGDQEAAIEATAAAKHATTAANEEARKD